MRRNICWSSALWWVTKGLRVGAARDRVQHRRLDLDEAVLDHEAADRRERLAARREARARGLVGDQVDVALAVLLSSASARPWNLSGSGRRLLVSRRSSVDLDRQLAGLGLEQRALGADDVAEVAVLEVAVVVLADRVDADAQLDPAARVLQRREARLAHDALEHQAAGDRDRDRLRLERLVVEVAVLARQLGGAVLRLEVVRKGDAARADRGELLAALGDQRVLVDGRRRGGGRKRSWRSRAAVHSRKVGDATIRAARPMSSRYPRLTAQAYFLGLATINTVHRFLPFFARRWLYRLCGFQVDPSATIQGGVRFFHVGRLRIGAGTLVNRGVYLDNRVGIVIGKNVSIAHDARIYTLGHDVHDASFAAKGSAGANRRLRRALRRRDGDAGRASRRRRGGDGRSGRDQGRRAVPHRRRQPGA